jgi:hypothetical protein
MSDAILEKMIEIIKEIHQDDINDSMVFANLKMRN